MEDMAGKRLVEVPRSACRSLEFHRAAEVIDLGRDLARGVLDALDKPETPALES
jgi:NTE family protein